MTNKPTYEDLVRRISELEKEVVEIRQREDALRQSEQRYFSLLDSSPDAIVVYDMKGNATYVNTGFEETFGWKSLELIGKRVDFVPEVSVEETKAAIKEMLSGRKVHLFETKRLTKDGRIIDVQLSSSQFPDQYGNPAGNIVTLRDISKQKQVENALKRERKLFVGGPVIAFKLPVTKTGRVEFVSSNVTQFGWQPEIFIDGEKSYYDLLYPEDLGRAKSEIEDSGKRDMPYCEREYRIVRGDGQIRWVYDFTILIRDDAGRISNYDSYLLDITDRRRAEEAMRASEKKLLEILQGTSIPTFVIDENHLITHYNRACENLTGIRAIDILGTNNHWMAFYDRQRPVLADFVADNSSEEDIAEYYETRYRKSPVIAGAYEAEGFFPSLGEGGKWLFFTAAPLKNAEGRILGSVETLQDVTDRTQAEMALEKSARRYRTLLEFIPYPMAVFDLTGCVDYLNPAFTQTFGWTFEELKGRQIPYVPPGIERETAKYIEKLLSDKHVPHLETKRMTKDGQILDVVIQALIYSEFEGESTGEIVILRDITREKRTALNNAAMLRISLALPEHTDLENLLDYISQEIKKLLDTEGALVILLDEEKEELFFLGAAYDDKEIEKRIKTLRFPMNQLMAGQVIRTGEPVIVSDTTGHSELFPERDKKLGYHTRNFVEVPLRGRNRFIGTLAALNKKEGEFLQMDIELLSMISSTVAISVENTRFSDELQKSYNEVASMNRAKDKVINHLSHELKTPVSVLSGSLKILNKKLATLPEKTWKPTFDRLGRSLNRIEEIQLEVDDILYGRFHKARNFLMLLLDQCRDELESLVADQMGEGSATEMIRKRIEEIYGLKDLQPEKIALDAYLRKRLVFLRELFAHRRLKIAENLAQSPVVYMPPDPLRKLIDGIVRNAVENTPDGGKMDIIVREKGRGSELIIRDYGVGIPKSAQTRIFEGFFTTRDMMTYSSKRPFDFNAGGKGADLLRIRIFSERHSFKMNMTSVRCRHIPTESDTCPGRIDKCGFCQSAEDCYDSGGTCFTFYFPCTQTSE